MVATQHGIAVDAFGREPVRVPFSPLAFGTTECYRSAIPI
jgi:hypothetical protein